MNYTKSELLRINALERSFKDVYGSLNDKANKLFERIDANELATVIENMMGVESIDGERLSDFLVGLTDAQAITELEREVATIESGLVERYTH